MIKIYERRKIMLKRWFINEKIMKKFLCLILSVMLTMSFVACDIDNSATPDGSPSPPASVTPNGTLLPSNSVTPTIKPTATPDNVANVDGVFVVSDKKYDYDGKNIVIMNVENTSKNGYNLLITGKYLDASGNELATETKTFEGFGGEWSNYFVFNPGIKFSKFEYELESSEFNGVAMASYIQPMDNPGRFYVFKGFVGAYYIEDVPADVLKDCNRIQARSEIYHTYDKALDVEVDVVIFDRNGKVLVVTTKLHRNVGGKGNPIGFSYKSRSCKALSGISYEIDKIEELKDATSISGIKMVDLY